MRFAIINLVYILSSVMFIVGLKGLSHPRKAVRGIVIAALGMLLAIIATLYEPDITHYYVIAAGLVIGALIGTVLAIRVKMTAMPQLVALFNGFGGAASFLVAGTALLIYTNAEGVFTYGLLADGTVDPEGGRAQFLIATALSGLIGAVTFSGSFVGYVKLEEIFKKDTIWFPGQQALNAAVALVCILLGAWIFFEPPGILAYVLLVLVALALGVLLVIPIGGADMPVVISLLNSYSGIAATATGFVLNNNMLIIAGSLVGASGIILTQIMCKAMNRSMTNVLFGRYGGGSDGPKADDVYAGKVKSASPEEIAMLMDGARRVVIVPGYGMAVAQAQYAVRDMANLLESKGIEVAYAIHPVAGRMPGHMNVLLAEANVPYEQLQEMDAINPTMEQTDVAIVLGANDVVNPMARLDDGNPVSGMPIINVDKARNVVVIKRSLSPGFAGIPNPLFAGDNTLMYFADGKKAIIDLIAAIKES